MNLALAHNDFADLHEAWLETHGAAWCHRLTATITAATCTVNRSRLKSYSTDCRCAGCNGLDDQPGAGLSFLPLVLVEDPEVDECPAGIQEEPEEECDLSDVEEDDLDEDDLDVCIDKGGLSDFNRKMLGILQSEPERSELEPLTVPGKKGGRLHAVFVGRCPRCRGFMIPSPEYQGDQRDTGVYRCQACGWRTSPIYEQNRMLFAPRKER
jgi:hypothetical protein